MTKFSALPVREVVGDTEADADADADADQGWPFTLGPVGQMLRSGLKLSSLTILVGENGVGKSTIVEAIAMAYGLNAEGGSTNPRHSPRPTESRLHERIRLVRGLSRSRWGYFLRAETMHGLLTYLEDNPSSYQAETRYHERSHGQAFNELLTSKVGHMSRARGGFLVLDEPEAGLSFLSQVTLAHQLAELRKDGIQVLIATHSPILAATPGAHIVELDDAGFRPREWNQLTTVALYRRFLTDPGYFLLSGH